MLFLFWELSKTVYLSLREHEGDMASPGEPDPLRPDIELARWVHRVTILFNLVHGEAI